MNDFFIKILYLWKQIQFSFSKAICEKIELILNIENFLHTKNSFVQKNLN